MKTAIVLLTTSLLLACGGSAASSGSDLATGAAAASASSPFFEVTSCFGPGEATTYPPDPARCFGHQFSLIGCFTARLHYVNRAGGEAPLDNYLLRYDEDAVFVENFTGETWNIRPGMNNGGAELWPPGADPSRFNDHEHTPIVNSITGDRLTIWGKWHFVTNAAGDVMVQSFDVFCSAP